MSQRQVLEQWAKQNPGLFEGLKQAISGAEGTILGGKPGYNVMFGGGRFSDFSRHPDKVIRSRSGIASAAAGAYQFMPPTWGEVQGKLGLKDFGPQSQDLGMLYKVRQRLMPMGGLAAITKAGTLTPEIQAALAPEWASFPTASGASYYGQPVKRAGEIQKFFEQGRQRASQPSTTAQPAAQTASSPAPQTPVERGNLLGRSLLQRVMGALPVMRPQSSLEMLDSAQSTSYLPADPGQFLKFFIGDESFFS